MAKLTLELNSKIFKEHHLKSEKGLIMMTPPIDKDYWHYRVQLYKEQAILAFPKFGTIGIGFAIEDDWNTNLPYTSKSNEIYQHIKHNKKYKINAKKCIEAIEMIQKAIKENKETE